MNNKDDYEKKNKTKKKGENAKYENDKINQCLLYMNHILCIILNIWKLVLYILYTPGILRIDIVKYMLIHFIGPNLFQKYKKC